MAIHPRKGYGLGFVAGLLLAAGVAVGSTTAVAQTAPAAQPAPVAQTAPTATQSVATSDLAFDVATVKPSAPLDPVKLQAAMQSGHMPRFGAHVDASRAEYNYMTLKDLVVTAYKVKVYQVSGPSWLGDQHFDIVAKLPDGASKDDAPKMLQALLADRFKLTVHRETAEHPVLALLVAKGGAKLKESPTAPVPIDPDAPLKPGEMKMDGPDGPIRITRNSDGTITQNMGAKGIVTMKMDSQAMHLNADTVTMDGFADMLTGVMQIGSGGKGGRTVVDMTELKGNYQVAVDISMADLMAAARAQGMDVPTPKEKGSAAGIVEADDPSGSTVYSSVQKLGLKLEQRKANVEQIVVDHAEKMPTEN